MSEMPVFTLADKVATLHAKMVELHIKRQVANMLLKVSMVSQKEAPNDRPDLPGQDAVEVPKS